MEVEIKKTLKQKWKHGAKPRKQEVTQKSKSLKTDKKRRTIKMQIEKGEKGINICREENTGNTSKITRKNIAASGRTRRRNT